MRSSTPAPNETTVSSVFDFPDQLGPEAQAVIRSELIRWLGRIECAFACRWDPDARSITTARLVSRGNASTVILLGRDLEPGEIFVHNHPRGGIWPSDEDLEAAAGAAKLGCGFGIIDSEATTLFMVRYPPTTRDLDTPTIVAKAPAPASGEPRLSWGAALSQLDTLARRDPSMARIHAAIDRYISDRCYAVREERQRNERLHRRVAELEAQLRRLTGSTPVGDRRRTG